MKHGAPHELFTIYSLCKTFHKLPSELENEDPVLLQALMQVEKAVASKERNDAKVREAEEKWNK